MAFQISRISRRHAELFSKLQGIKEIKCEASVISLAGAFSTLFSNTHIDQTDCRDWRCENAAQCKSAHSMVLRSPFLYKSIFKHVSQIISGKCLNGNFIVFVNPICDSGGIEKWKILLYIEMAGNFSFCRYRF